MKNMKNEFKEYYRTSKKEAHEVLINNLKMGVPEIKRLESLECLVNLNLTNVKDFIDNSGALVILSYIANAPNVYPNIRDALIDCGVAKEHDIISTNTEKKGKPDEFVSTHLGYYDLQLQIFLDVYKNNLETHNSPSAIKPK